MLELCERLLQPGVPLGAMDFPMRVSPLANTRVMPFSNADTLISGRSIINLLIVDSAVFDHGLYQSMAQTGTIGSACFRHEGSIGIFRGIANFRKFRKQDFTSDLNQPFAKREGWGNNELMYLFKVGVNGNRAGSRPHSRKTPDVLINRR